MEISVFGHKCRLEILVFCVLLGFILSSMTLCSCCKMNPSNLLNVVKQSTDVVKEGFNQISNIAEAASLDYNMNQDLKSNWTDDALNYASGMGNDTSLSKNTSYKGTPVPLEGTMNFFKNNSFKPECCPSTYSNSTGCACLSVDQLNYLNERGGNREIYSS